MNIMQINSCKDKHIEAHSHMDFLFEIEKRLTVDNCQGYPDNPRVRYSRLASLFLAKCICTLYIHDGFVNF